MVYAWCVEKMQNATKDEYTEWHENLFAPRTGRDPDKVTQEVIEEEMSLFTQLRRQTGTGGDL